MYPENPRARIPEISMVRKAPRASAAVTEMFSGGGGNRRGAYPREVHEEDQEEDAEDEGV